MLKTVRRGKWQKRLGICMNNIGQHKLKACQFQLDRYINFPSGMRLARPLLTWILLQGICVTAFSQNDVAQQVMRQVYEEIKTPYKYGLVVTPADEAKKIDCPS